MFVNFSLTIPTVRYEKIPAKSQKYSRIISHTAVTFYENIHIKRSTCQNCAVYLRANGVLSQCLDYTGLQKAGEMVKEQRTRMIIRVASVEH
jgi:hypothetical protein